MIQSKYNHRHVILLASLGVLLSFGSCKTNRENQKKSEPQKTEQKDESNEKDPKERSLFEALFKR